MSIQEQQPHEMILERTHTSGVDEWYCPTCGRRFLMQVEPAYKKLILEPGDEEAAHRGGKSGLSIESIETLQAEEDQISDESYRFWQEALKDLDLDDLGDETAA